MAYISPIELTFNRISEQINQKTENLIMQAIYETGIKVDKEELIKALDYDRKQYEQGYEDARQDYIKPSARWIITGQENGALGITYKQRRCSNCGWEHSMAFKMNYCPDCGAIMSLPEEKEQE